MKKRYQKPCIIDMSLESLIGFGVSTCEYGSYPGTCSGTGSSPGGSGSCITTGLYANSSSTDSCNRGLAPTGGCVTLGNYPYSAQICQDGAPTGRSASSCNTGTGAGIGCSTGNSPLGTACAPGSAQVFIQGS